jgi:DNA-binding MarR family transcriptional regulator
MVQKMQSHDKPTLLEVVLRLHGEFRRRLEPLRVTVLQAGVILYLTRHTNAKLTETAAALRIRPPTLTEVIRDLVSRRWVTNRRSPRDRRAVCLRLSRRGQVIARSITGQVRQVSPVAPDIDPTIPGVTQLESEPTNLKEV